MRNNGRHLQCQHKAIQEAFDARRLADRLNDVIVLAEIADKDKGFIESRDMFFLSTVDHRGYPTCSYKGGNPGFVKVLDRETLAFPSYNGNGMFLSMANISANGKIGMLFIDFETPHRLRVHGDASVSRDDPFLADFHGAELVVRVKIAEIFINGPRYIHKYQRVATSKYVPQTECATPAPQWKRIAALQDALPARDRTVADKLGGTIEFEEYEASVVRGDG